MVEAEDSKGSNVLQVDLHWTHLATNMCSRRSGEGRCDTLRPVSATDAKATTAEEAAAGWRAFLAAGDIEGGRAFLAPVLERGGPATRDLALAFYGDGLFLFRLGEQEASRERNEQAFELALEAQDAEVQALALVGLSRIAYRARRYANVVELAARARELAHGADRQASLASLNMLAAGTRLLGDFEGAAELYGESMELARELGNDRMVAMEQHNLGHVELHRGNLDEAERLFAARLAFAGGSPDPYERAMTALDEGCLAAVRGQDDVACERLAETKHVLSEHGIVLDPDDAFELQALEVLVG